jgi:3-hydroxybutyryl-CoA dehydrogenase
MTEKIKTVGIIGAGFMGCQIASRAAVFGYTVKMFDVKPEVLTAAKATTRAYTDMHFGDNKSEADAADARITYHGTIAEALKDVDLAFEVVPENIDLKNKIVAEMDAAMPKHAILASNSSSIPVSRMEGAIGRKDKIANVHFYIPISERNMVDIMGGTQTSKETMEAAEDWVRSIHCIPMIAKKECMGFVFNRVWRAIKRDALAIWAGGYADLRDVDRGWMVMTGMNIGPFGAMDYVGLDVVYDIEMSYYNDSKDPKDKPPQALKDMVDKGLKGVKTGKGFYDWSNPEFMQPDFLNPKKK